MNEETNQTTSEPRVVAPKNNILIPAAIVIAGALVAGAVFFTHSAPDQNVAGTTTAGTTTLTPVRSSSMDIAPVTAADHIQGSVDAKIILVEYSDLECPYCKAFQPTMEQLISQYGQSGDLAWVFRDFPLYKSGPNTVALHPKAEKEAEASECANQLGGPTAFWAFIDKIFQITPSNNGLDPAELPIVAGQIGLNVTAFNQCLNSGTYTQFISDSYDKAVAAGGTGTPYNIMVLQTALTAKQEQAILTNVQSVFAESDPGVALPSGIIIFSTDGTKIALDGALPYDIMNSIIQTILTGK